MGLWVTFNVGTRAETNFSKVHFIEIENGTLKVALWWWKYERSCVSLHCSV